MARLTGDANQFWNNVSTGAGGNSAVVEIGQGMENITIFITTSGSSIVKVQVAHHGDLSIEGVEPDAAPSVWHDLYYGTQQQLLTVNGSAALVIPDIAFKFIRLQSASDVTATAGWSAKGE